MAPWLRTYVAAMLPLGCLFVLVNIDLAAGRRVLVWTLPVLAAVVGAGVAACGPSVPALLRFLLPATWLVTAGAAVLLWVSRRRPGGATGTALPRASSARS